MPRDVTWRGDAPAARVKPSSRLLAAMLIPAIMTSWDTIRGGVLLLAPRGPQKCGRMRGSAQVCGGQLKPGGERKRSITPIQAWLIQPSPKADSGAARTSPGRSHKMKQCAPIQGRTSTDKEEHCTEGALDPSMGSLRRQGGGAQGPGGLRAGGRRAGGRRAGGRRAGGRRAQGRQLEAGLRPAPPLGTAAAREPGSGPVRRGGAGAPGARAPHPRDGKPCGQPHGLRCRGWQCRRPRTGLRYRGGRTQDLRGGGGEGGVAHAGLWPSSS